MNIPESDHLMVANLIAFGALVLTAIIGIFTVLQTIKARKLNHEANVKLDEANAKASEANEIANSGLLIARDDYYKKHSPIFEATEVVHIVAIDDYVNNMILLRIKNIVDSEPIVTRISISGYFQAKVNTPLDMPLNNPIAVFLEFKNKSIMEKFIKIVRENRPTGKTEDSEFEIRVIEEIRSHTIYIFYTYNNKEFVSTLDFETGQNKFVGKAIRIAKAQTLPAT